MVFYDYDPLNRLKIKTTIEKTITYDYDKAGRLTTAVDGASALFYEYDTAARLWQVTRSDGKNISKAYDAAGNLIQLTYPDGYFLTYTYDTRNRLEQILESGVTALVTYQYDSLSRRSGIIHANGVITTASHEPDNDIAGIDYQFNSENVTFSY